MRAVLILSREQVEELLDLGALVDAVGHAMADLSAGSASMPPRVAAEAERSGILAAIVHAADVSEDLHSVPEGPGLAAIAHGFAYLHGTRDHRKIELETPMYDALYEWCAKGGDRKERT